MRSIFIGILFQFFFSTIAFARFSQAPPNFDLKDGSGRAVFLDFLTADYSVTYDMDKQETRIRSVITFQNDEEGFPVFDLIDDPTFVGLDGQASTQSLIDTPHDTQSTEFSEIRIIQKIVAVGRHQLIIEHILKAFPAEFRSNGVESGFFMSDFESRGLLERYLPTNFEYDQFKITLNISLLGTVIDELVFTNGTVASQSNNKWTITFPPHFNCSALYFHIRPKEDLAILRYNFASTDGRQIPVTIYEAKGPWNNLADFKSVIDQNLPQYENLYGPFPHPSMIIFVNGMMGAGMEYAGAASTDLDSLPHELAHSYFGRGVLSANGNSGWIDEAMASITGGPKSPNPKDLQPSNMANHSSYFRSNDSLGYYNGQNFLLYLGDLFAQKNSSLSLNGFLKKWISQRNQQVITTEILRADMEQYSGIELKKLFNTYVYATP